MERLSRKIEILMVEDNPGDVRLFREALETCEVKHELSVAGDGEIAMALLRREGAYSETVRPDLVILDWNLPKKCGKEVLQEIKSDESLASIPVVVFTTSRAPQDIRDTYDGRGNCFITKPAHFRQFVEAVESIKEFWLTVALLPR
jgi:CheY-like chemotaxis protein